MSWRGKTSLDGRGQKIWWLWPWSQQCRTVQEGQSAPEPPGRAGPPCRLPLLCLPEQMGQEQRGL